MVVPARGGGATNPQGTLLVPSALLQAVRGKDTLTECDVTHGKVSLWAMEFLSRVTPWLPSNI